MNEIDPRTIVSAVGHLAAERGVPIDDLWQGIADALHEAYLRLPDAFDDVALEIDIDSFTLAVKRVDGTDVTPEGFGRVGAGVFKREIAATVQRVQRRQALTVFTGRELTMVSGVVTHCTPRRAVIRVGNLEAVLPRSEQIPGEMLRRDQEIEAVLVELRHDGPDAMLLSRMHPQFLPQLLMQLVPAVASGAVTVEALARIPGQRTKVAISSPLGAREALRYVVGQGGVVIRGVQRALGPERVELVPFDSDPWTFVAAAVGVEMSCLTADGDVFVVRVPADQVAKVVGTQGSNVKAAVQLTGFDIRIESND